MAERPMFDLTLDEDQRLTRESVRRFMERHLRPNARALDEAGSVPAGVYKASAELGLSLMALPEALGGAGVRDPMSTVLTAEDLGEGDMSVALGILAPLGFINAMRDFADEQQQARFLAPLAGEDFVPASVALMEPRATFTPAELQTLASVDGDHYVLNGEKSMVVLGVSARLLLVIAQLAGEPNAFIVSRDTPGLSVQPQRYMGLRALEMARVRLEDVRVPADCRLPRFDLERLVDLSRIGLAAVAVGCCQAVLDYTIPYVKERHAFGEPIARRQSVAFMVANMGIELEGMRLLVWKAASRAGRGLPFHRDACLAHMFCAEKAMQIGTDGLQLFGGAGFVRDYPLEMWYRNLRAVAVLEAATMV